MLKAHPGGVFIIPSWLRDACVRSEYPGSLILGSICVLFNPGLNREAFRRFFYAHAWGEVAMNAVYIAMQ